MRWVASCIGRYARVLRTRRLPGSASVTDVTLDDGHGRRVSVVLRRYPREHVPWSADSAGTLLEHEARVLDSLDGSRLPTPTLVALSMSIDEPALVMSKLPGHPALRPPDLDSHALEMASALARVHALAIDCGGADEWADPARLSVPDWPRTKALWERAIRLVLDSKPPDGRSFLHGDYSSQNVLFVRGKLTGIVDWAEARTGHPDRDVSRCRIAFATRFTVDAAERFRDAYESEAGRLVDPRVDVYGILGWAPWWRNVDPASLPVGMRNMPEGMEERVENLLERALRRADA